MDPLNAQKHAERHSDEVVLVLSKNTADLFHDADDHELIVPDANVLPDGINVEKQALHQRVADQAHVCAVLGFRSGEIAPELHRARVNIDHARRLAVEVYVLILFVAESCPHGGAGRGTDLLAIRTTFGDRAYVVQLDLLVLERLDDDVEVRHCKRRARYLEDVGTEIGDLVFHIEIRALYDGHHRDERGHPHRQPKNGQRSAQLVSAQGAEALGEVVTDC